MLITPPNLDSIVVQHNSVVDQLALFNINELRLLAFCLAHVTSPTPKDELTVATIKDFTNIFPIDPNSAYAVVSKVMKSIGGKPLEIKVKAENTAEVDRLKFRNWFSGFDYLPKKGRFEFKINPDVQPYVQGLKSNFTSYLLGSVYQFKKAHTWLFYSQLKRWCGAGKWTVSVDELREKMSVDNKYPAWSDFRKYILSKDLDLINKDTDLDVTFQVVRELRAITAIVFTIKFKSDEAKKEDEENKDHEQKTPQMLLFDELVKIKIHVKVAEKYSREAEDKGKTEVILNKLPSMIKRAKEPKQKYILGSIKDELKQLGLYPDQEAQAKLYREAVKCWDDRGKQCQRRTNLKTVCEICEKIC